MERKDNGVGEVSMHRLPSDFNTAAPKHLQAASYSHQV